MLLGVVGKWNSYQRLQELPGIGKILGLTIALGDRRRPTLRRRRELRQLLPGGVEEPAPEQRQEERREQPQMRQPLPGLGVCGAAHFAAAMTSGCRRFYGPQSQTNQSDHPPPRRWPGKLAKAAWHVMKENVSFDADRVLGPAAKKLSGRPVVNRRKGSGRKSPQD